MIATKSCPRCNGDLLLEELLGEAEMVCLQCGHRTYPQPEPLRLTARRVVKEAA